MKEATMTLAIAVLVLTAWSAPAAKAQLTVTDDILITANLTCQGMGPKCFCQEPGPSPRPRYKLELSLSVPPRSLGDGPFPVILLIHGFGGQVILSTPDYEGYASAAAAAGFALLQYDLAGWFKTAPDPVELDFLPSLLDWLRRANSQQGTPAAGRLDLSRLAVAGHSRGGKLAALHFARSPATFFAAFLLDPVDCPCFAPCGSNCYPSARAALAAAAPRPLAAAGASVRGCCNPGDGAACGAVCATACYFAAGNSTCTGSGYQDLVEAAGEGGAAFELQAGHMQFATLPPVKQALADGFCGAALGVTSQAVCTEAAGHMLDWFRSKLPAAQPVA